MTRNSLQHSTYFFPGEGDPNPSAHNPRVTHSTDSGWSFDRDLNLTPSELEDLADEAEEMRHLIRVFNGCMRRGGSLAKHFTIGAKGVVTTLHPNPDREPDET